LAGLDGEATEDRVETLVESNDNDMDLEAKFGLAKNFATELEGVTGVDISIKHLGESDVFKERYLFT
jgi:hypothetical protein